MNQKERSIRDGEQVEVGNQIYFGRPPVFKFIAGQWIKVRKGVPFVKP
jgi:hypothetical protein